MGGARARLLLRARCRGVRTRGRARHRAQPAEREHAGVDRRADRARRRARSRLHPGRAGDGAQPGSPGLVPHRHEQPPSRARRARGGAARGEADQHAPARLGACGGRHRRRRAGPHGRSGSRGGRGRAAGARHGRPGGRRGSHAELEVGRRGRRADAGWLPQRRWHCGRTRRRARGRPRPARQPHARPHPPRRRRIRVAGQSA